MTRAGARLAVRCVVPAVGLLVSCGGVREPPVTATSTAAVWVHRRLVVGRARAEASLDELTLEIHGTRATLVVMEKRAAQGGVEIPPGELPFREINRTTLRGTVTSSANALDLALANESGATRMHCTRVRRRVAPADAVRVRDPRFESECPNRGVWLPSAEVETDALVCVSANAATGADVQPVTFGRAPGIELLGIQRRVLPRG